MDNQVREYLTEAVENCPECGNSNNYPGWDSDRDGYIAVCKTCGKKIFLCDNCMHADDNPRMECNWREMSNGAEICRRGIIVNHDISAMTTRNIMCDAFAMVFGIPSSKDTDASYYDNRYDRVMIDYAIFDNGRYDHEFDMDTDYFWAKVEDGSEGTWIAVYREHHLYGDTEEHRTDNVGTIKTLDGGRDAWKAMGALAGELVYTAHRVAWEYWKAHQEAEKGSAQGK